MVRTWEANLDSALQRGLKVRDDFFYRDRQQKILHGIDHCDVIHCSSGAHEGKCKWHLHVLAVVSHNETVDCEELHESIWAHLVSCIDEPGYG